MRQPIEPGELMSSTDIARLLGVVPSAISNWVARNVGFPRAAVLVNDERTPLWWREDVLAWVAGRKAGVMHGKPMRKYGERVSGR